MNFSAISIWIAQIIVVGLVYRDLSPAGPRLVARWLGLEHVYSIWIYLIALTVACVFAGSRIAANTFAAHTGKRPSEDWHSYGQSGVAEACYWCGLASFVASLFVAQRMLPGLLLPGLRPGVVCAMTLLVDCVSMRAVVRALLRRRHDLSVRRGRGAVPPT